jgi:ADP-ribose pyrophosphatase YjhB (NUDIX family)
MSRKHAHCGYCGRAFAPDQPWPRTCAGCNEISYLNPLPVVVLLLPVDDGLLCVRRTIEPRAGWLSLPGGFLDEGESWQAGCVRELFEETNVRIDPAEIELFRVFSPDPPWGFVLIFGLARHRRLEDLPPFEVNSECSERVVLTAPQELAFPTHTQAVVDYFASRSE